jgi:hypothetical protein
MLSTYLKLWLVGCTLAIGFIGSYLIYRKCLKLNVWAQISVKAVVFGIALTFIACIETSLLVFIAVLGIAAVAYFAEAAQQDQKLEQVLVATMGGILIGLTNLASMLLCC